nr:hypothetical protein [Tanacetum cinerariifolium]
MMKVLVVQMPVHIIVKDTRTMDMTIDQQVALDKALVPHASRPRIGKRNFRLRSNITSKESTLQMMKHIVNLECFREMLHICPRLPDQTFDELSFKEEIMAFLRFLGHYGKIRKLTDVNINKLHQPWRSFAAIINKCLSGKSTGYDSLWLSQAQILWGMYHKKNIDFAYLLWEDFVYQVEHKDAKKSNEIDDQMFTTIKLVSRHQNTQKFGVMLPVELTNKDIRNSEAYKEYYAVASGAAPPKTKASVKKTKSSSDTTVTPPTAAGTRLLTSPCKKACSKLISPKLVVLVQMKELVLYQGFPMYLLKSPMKKFPWKSSDEDDVDERSDDQETKDEESFYPIVQIPKNSNDKGNDDANLGLNVGSEERQDAEDDDNELYRDVSINRKGRDVQMTDVHTTQEFKDTHVNLTPVNPDDTYGDTVTLKRRRDDADKDEEPSARSDRGSKRLREGKEPESTSAPKEKVTKTTEKFTQGSKYHQKTASESTPVEEPMQTTKDLEEPHIKSLKQFYGFAVNRESARNVYSKRRIIAVTECQIVRMA